MIDDITPKEAAPDPEIPSELRAKLARPKRPGGLAGFSPKAGEDAEDDNAKPEPEPVREVKDLRDFFKRLRVVLKTAKCFKVVIEQKDVRKKIPGSKATEWVREQRKVKIPVTLGIGQDGLPFTTEPVTAEETHRVRCETYPDAPPMDKILGDLTPEFVEWLFLNHPYDATVRYFARSTHVQAAALIA